MSYNKTFMNPIKIYLQWKTILLNYTVAMHMIQYITFLFS